MRGNEPEDPLAAERQREWTRAAVVLAVCAEVWAVVQYTVEHEVCPSAGLGSVFIPAVMICAGAAAIGAALFADLDERPMLPGPKRPMPFLQGVLFRAVFAFVGVLIVRGGVMAAAYACR